jgi:hypothetical protein
MCFVLSAASVRRVMQRDAVSIRLPDSGSNQLRVHALDFPESKDFPLEVQPKLLASAARALFTFAIGLPGLTNLLGSQLTYFRPIRRCHSVAGVQVPPQGFLTYTEAAPRLFGQATDVIAGLVAQGVLGASAGNEHD